MKSFPTMHPFQAGSGRGFMGFSAPATWRLLCLWLCLSLPGFATEERTLLLQDTFSTLSPSWRPFSLSGREGAQPVLLPGGGLRLELSEGRAEYGVFHEKAVSGNFQVEAEFEEDDAVGIAVFACKDGLPDLQNYTLLSVTRRGGVVTINQYDRQNGRANVHDPRQLIAPERYESVLDGRTFSVPFQGTNKRVRLLHESLSNTFHFYYGTRLERWGITSDDWLELAPQYSWLPPGQEYLVAVLCRNEGMEEPRLATFRSVKVERLPTEDLDDSRTGFKVSQRDFSWSGFSGKATVVSFGEDFEHDKNLKFVLWDRANNAPVWRLSNQFLLSFEFFEGGDSIHPGCHEAMSDRQRHGQSIVVEEDNEVRKVVRWKGVPMNPQYHYSGEGTGGAQLPWYEEIWTLYPDGQGTRQLLHYPKLDSAHRMSWGPEFIEFMPIGGSTVEAGDLCDSPALTLLDLGSHEESFHPPSPQGVFDPDTWTWKQLIMSAHFRGGVPDFYLAYNQSPSMTDTWCGIPLQGQLSWHRTGQRFSHWPVGREPYGQNAKPNGRTSRSYATHINEVTHTSLVSAGYYERGVDWSDGYLLDASGRPYRRHVMLTGVSRPRDFEGVRSAVSTWLEPGVLESLEGTCRYLSNNRLQRLLVLEQAGKRGDGCRFLLRPGVRPVLNPAFQVNGWTGGSRVEARVDGQPVPCRSALVEGRLLVWLRTRLTVEARVEFRSRAAISGE